MNDLVKEDIAKINDTIRNHLCECSYKNHKINAQVVVTSSVSTHPKRKAILNAARFFDSFTEENDPYKEHDCAYFEVDGERFMFKMDYYDNCYEYGEDPYIKIDCNRVLTIMHASER